MAIKRCDCKHKYQDEKHGKGMRVKNPCETSPVTYRCTVCGTQENAQEIARRIRNQQKTKK